MLRRIAAACRAIERGYWKFRARLQFLGRGVKWPAGLRVLGPLGLSSPGNLLLGDRVTIVNSSTFNRAGVNHPTQLVACTGATLTIGNDVGMSGTSIYCAQAITIGNHVLIGANCRIYDTDFHPMNHMARRHHEPAQTSPVIIGDDVWLGANVTILKGVTIGARSVIAAGSVVADSIGPDTLAGGIPARPIRLIAP